jgi:hypothetical protein
MTYCLIKWYLNILQSDDCILYRTIENHQDCVTLQMDLNKLALWGSTWGMQYHPQKCNSLSITRSRAALLCTLSILSMCCLVWGAQIEEQYSKFDLTMDLYARLLVSSCLICKFLRKKLKIWSHQPHVFNYTPKGHVLESVNITKYLGITLSSNMSWDTHINNITAKANKILSFLRRNLQGRS